MYGELVAPLALGLSLSLSRARAGDGGGGGGAEPGRQRRGAAVAGTAGDGSARGSGDSVRRERFRRHVQ